MLGDSYTERNDHKAQGCSLAVKRAPYVSVCASFLGSHSFGRRGDIDGYVRSPADPGSASGISGGLWIVERRAPWTWSSGSRGTTAALESGSIG